MYMQLGCLALELIIQVSDQPVAPSFGRKPWLAGLAATGSPSPFSGEVLVLPGGADLVVAVGEGLDLLGRVRPVFADVGMLFLQQVDRRFELLFVQLVGVFDPQARFVDFR